MSLYLKYRPNNFKNIVGQSQVIDILKAEINNNKFSHSYIFFGPRGTGKTSTARIFAKAINCLNKGEKPCNKCTNCNLINEGKTLDFIEIDAASNTQVDKIREEIIDKAIYPPTTLKYKVYVIDEVHMLSKSAFNALLKIMEEPPEYLVFILATTEIHKIPETIISRCEMFNFKRIKTEEIINRLIFICKNEKINYTKEGLELISKIADGGLRDAIKYLEQVSIIGEVNLENVSKFLGIAPEKKIITFLNNLKSQNLDKIFDNIVSLQKEGIDLNNFVKDCLLYLNQHLTDNISENIKLVELLDKVYQNFRNYPSPELTLKTIIGLSLLQNSNEKDLDTKNTKDTKDKIKKTNNFITKEELINNITSPIVKGIIKNFSHIEQVNGTLIITVISKTNYSILTQPENIKILTKSLKKINPDIKFEIVYKSKEDFFNQKLLA